MSILKTHRKAQFYLDSVALMRMSKSLTDHQGVEDAAMMMATPANVEIMFNAGLLEAAMEPAPGDLLLSVRAVEETTANQVLQSAMELLEKPQGGQQGTQWRPRSIRSAVSVDREANLALISVPGDFAASEGRKAIRNGLHAMIFSDNVSLEEEAELKREALALGKLVMGPDCGTAIINGVPLAFANRLPRGNIGIVGASGTGIQEVSCLLGNAGFGLSHAIGVGGRDLSAAVGAISTLMAIDALLQDPETEQIILISKPPAAEIAGKVLAKVAESNKPFTICFIGGEKPALPDNAQWAATLFDAANAAAGNTLKQSDTMLNTSTEDNNAPTSGHLIKGLFCGGTLCAEAQVIMRSAGLEFSSNAPIAGASDNASGKQHLVIDLGADEYTQGKPHPMIEPGIRDQHINAALSDEATAVVLVDCVIGLGAHANPAQMLSNCMKNNSRAIPVVASVTGTENDPQVLTAQRRLLQQAGIQIASSNAAAVTKAIELLQR